MVYSLNLLYKYYSQAYFLRLVDETISKNYHQNFMRCPTHLSIGQEGISAAFSLLVNQDDFTVSTHRGHYHYLSKGGNLYKFFCEIMGKKDGCSKGKGGSMHLIDLDCNFMGTSAIVGNSIPLGVGLGLSIKQKNQKSISIVFLGEGATEEGVFYESLNFSSVKDIPVLFICENNLYSVYSPIKVRQPKNRKIYQLSKSIGVQSIHNNGSQPKKIFSDLKESMDYVRKKRRPFLLEVDNYRYLEHCGPNKDDNLNYRSKAEINKWKKKDFLLKVISEIKKNDKNYVNKITSINTHHEKYVNQAFNKAMNSKNPIQNDAFTSAYA